MNNLTQSSKLLLWNPFHKFACRSVMCTLASVSGGGILPNVFGAKDAKSQKQSTPKISRRYFDENYRERTVLGDGTVATLRLARSTDHDLWVDCFKRISPESRYLRFCSAKKALTEQEIRYFTVVDQEKHFCIVAVKEELDSNGKIKEIALGIGRFICAKEDPSIAEPAIVVMDDSQNQGLGYLIALRLLAAARERNVTTFEATVLGTNTKVVRLMKDLSPDTKICRDGMDMIITSKLPFVPPDESWSHKHQIDQEPSKHTSPIHGTAFDVHINLNKYLEAKY